MLVTWRFMRNAIIKWEDLLDLTLPKQPLDLKCSIGDHRHRNSYSPFNYSGSSNLFWFLLHNESLRRNSFVQLMRCTSTFWKCVWFENIRSITNVMSMEVEKMSLEGVVHSFIWNRGMACRKNRCRFLPSATQEQFPAARLPSTHCHTAFRNAGMPSAMLGGDRQIMSLEQLLRRSSQVARK